MITVGGIKLKDLAELRATWTRGGDKYTSPDGNVTIWVAEGAVVGSCCELGSDCKPPFQPLWFCGPRYPIGYYGPGTVNSGCITKPSQWWEEKISAGVLRSTTTQMPRLTSTSGG